MKITRICIGAGCCLLLIISWTIAVNSKSTAEKQLALINQASVLMNDNIYIRAVPLLEEAAGYDAVHTLYAENELKRAYLALMDNRGFPRRYTALLEKQMNRKDADPTVFFEAANYYLGISKVKEALEILRSGIEKTSNNDLITVYENSRYAYEIHRPVYESVTAIYNSVIQVLLDGKWGIANYDGTLIIPCDYDKISTFSRDRAIVKKENDIYAIDRNNNRIAVVHKSVADFGNYGNDRIPLLIDGNWRRATGEFELGTSIFEDIGMYSGGYAAAKINDKWGVIDLSNDWLIPPEYDEVILDELGRCYAQNALFIRSGKTVFQVINGTRSDTIYEDAHPFNDEGYAAVKRNGKWGFIDSSGTEVIPFIFDDALSFGQHLAAVRSGEFWGYINIFGYIVIEPVFHEAKSFSNGSAPVLTERGWQFITLLEYQRGGLI